MKRHWLSVFGLCLLALSGACSGDDATPGPPPERTTSGTVPASDEPGPVVNLPPRTDLGSIQGHAMLSGRAPGNQVIRMGMDPKCAQLNTGKLVAQEEVVTTREGDLANVFVHLDGVFPRLPPPTEPVQIDQVDCVYIPRVAGAQVGQPVEILNSDDLLHNLHASSGVGNGFNVGQARAGLVFEFTPTAAEIMLHLGCDIHRWMTSYIGIVDHPYFDVTRNDGTFTIEDVPAGTYTIRTWHEVFGELSQSVEVREDEIQTVNFEYRVDGDL